MNGISSLVGQFINQGAQQVPQYKKASIVFDVLLGIGIILVIVAIVLFIYTEYVAGIVIIVLGLILTAPFIAQQFIMS